MSRLLLLPVAALCLSLGCEGSSDVKPSKGRPTTKAPSPTKAEKAAEAKADAKASPTPPPKVADAAAWTWTLPEGIATPPEVPADNPMSAQKVALGHKLFMDKRLSVDGSRSCYSCHQNHLGGADGRPTALGAKAKPLSRNTPTIWNVGLNKSWYWDSRAPTMEKQALGALKGGNMGLGDTLADKAAEIGALEEYAPAFKEVFGLAQDAKVEPEHIAKALSAYERTLLCGDTGFDKQVLSAAQKRGQGLFMGKAACITCHAGPNLSDGIQHVTGIAIDAKSKDADVGHFKVSPQDKFKFAFKTPTLRNVAKTGPYFHDGSVESLEEAVKLMASGGNPQDGLTVDQLLLDRKLTDAEIKDITAFLSATSCPGELKTIGDQTAEGIAPPPA